MPGTANIADREVGGFIVVDYSENPQGVTVFGPTTPQACGRYKESRRFRNSSLEVERFYFGAEE